MSTAPSPPPFEAARLIIVMGVSSSGKSSVGEALARRLAVPFLDGDQYHPEANVEKMRAGIALTDDDRWPWLERFARAMAEAADRKGAAVGACSALKRSYRDFLIDKAGEPILYVYLDGSRELIAERIAARAHHFMPASLLDSQFATLEIPGEGENVLKVGIEPPVNEIAAEIARRLDHLKSFRRPG